MIKESSNIIRIRIIGGIFAFLSLLVLWRLYMVQVVWHEIYEKQGANQYMTPANTLFDRGTISFTTKTGELWNAATLKTGYIVSINPQVILDMDFVYKKINEIVEIDKEGFYEKASKKNDPYEEIANKIEKSDAEKIIALKIKGVSVHREQWRFYPGNSIAAHTVGFVSYNNQSGDKLIGTHGLEKKYNDILTRAKNGAFVSFFAEIFSGLKDFGKESLSEGNIVTTIEPSVQIFLEGKIKSINEQYNGKVAGGIIMNPSTGEIYAMSIDPNFDLNDYRKVSSQEVYKNTLVENVYEIGSIVKPITMAIGIDTGAVSSKTTYDDTGSKTLNNRTFYNFDKKARGVVGMQEVLNQSLNTGVAFVVEKTGNEVFARYMKQLLGKETGIDLPNEALPLLSNLDSTRDIEFATASFGQGIAMSPISITRALASLGNGGFLVTPHLVKRIDYELGLSRDVSYPDPERVFKKETSEEISRMLVNVVDVALLKGEAKNDHYTVAAKTGTAQMVDDQTHKYFEDRYLHSFFGYFPAYDPKFIIFLYVVDPKNVNYASQTLTQPFLDLVSYLINYYQVPPDR